MSFILDALKKSETERQEQGSAEFTSVPTSSGSTSPARWLWLLAALLAVNFAVLIGILLKPDEPATSVAEIAQPEIAETSAGLEGPSVEEPSFADLVADAIVEIEERPVSTSPAPATEIESASTAVTAPPQTRRQPVARTTSVPTIDQLRLDGSLQLEELHLDIHVYSDEPAERFVFINMDKHREDSRIDEGPIVREITIDGVILEYQGRTFLLPRQ